MSDNYSEIQNNKSKFQDYEVDFRQNGEIILRRNLQNNPEEILSFDEITGYFWNPVVKRNNEVRQISAPAPNANSNSTKKLLKFNNNQSKKNSIKTAVKPVVNSIITGAVKKISDEQEKKKLELQKQSNNQKRKNALNSSKSVMNGIVKSVGEKLAKQTSSSSQGIDKAMTSSNSVMSRIMNTPQIQQVVPNNNDNWGITWITVPSSSQKGSEFTPNWSELNPYKIKAKNFLEKLNKNIKNQTEIDSIYDAYYEWISDVTRTINNTSKNDKNVIKNIIKKYEEFKRKHPSNKELLTPIKFNDNDRNEISNNLLTKTTQPKKSIKLNNQEQLVNISSSKKSLKNKIVNEAKSLFGKAKEFGSKLANKIKKPQPQPQRQVRHQVLENN